MPQENAIRVSDAIQLTGIPKTTMYRAIKDGDIPWIRTAGVLYIHLDTLADYLTSRRNKTRWQPRGEVSPRPKTYRRADSLKRKYSITPGDIEAVLMAQGGGCAICGATTPGTYDWSVDHCHAAGTLRGVLCGLCNTGLGFFKDNPAALRSAARYLEDAAALPSGRFNALLTMFS